MSTYTEVFVLADNPIGARVKLDNDDPPAAPKPAKLAVYLRVVGE